MKKLFTMLAVIAMITTFALTPVSAANLVINGDFENVVPTTGVTTDYTILDPSNTGDWTLGPPYMATVGSNPGLYHSAWMPGFTDHSVVGTNMMIVNGTTEGALPNKLVWGQDITGLIATPMAKVTYVDLIAGKNMDAGVVKLKVVDGKLYIKITADSPWVINGMHVAVAPKCCMIPQKNGNPIPGKFPLKMNFNGVRCTGWQEVPYSGSLQGPICIAVHAEVQNRCSGKNETAWGKGMDFPGKNWAMCICYTPEFEWSYGDYRVEFYAASSYWQNPAKLQLSINGDVLMPTLEATAVPGEWVKYSAVWHANTNHALIEIRDLVTEYWGDDFVIDDISFEKIS